MHTAAIFIVGGLVISNLVVFLFNGKVTRQASASSSKPLCSRYERAQSQGGLCISNRCSLVSYTKHAETYLAWDLLDPLHLIASYWVPPTGLMMLRFCLLLQASATVIVDAIYERSVDSKWLLRFDTWTCIMVGLSGLTGTLVSLKYWTEHAKQSASPRAALTSNMQLKRHQSDIPQHNLPSIWQDNPSCPSMAQEWSFLDCIFLLSLSIAAPAATTTPILYWPFSRMSVQAYVLQSSVIALLLLEVAASRVQFVSYHWQVYLLFCSAYLAVIWTHQAVTGKWLCAALDWSNASSILVYAGLLALTLVTWFVWYFIACFREALGQGLAYNDATAVLTRETINPVQKVCTAQNAREMSFASWNKPDFTDCQVVIDSGDMTLQHSASPTKRPQRGTAAPSSQAHV